MFAYKLAHVSYRRGTIFFRNDKAAPNLEQDVQTMIRKLILDSQSSPSERLDKPC